MKPTSTYKKAVLAAIATSLVFTPGAYQASQAAALDTQMENMFKSMGGMASVNGPGSFRSQSMGVISGGEIQWRIPARNYQLLSMQMPSISAGCGGIDARLGSFSYINEDKFKEMLEAIGDATVGLLFQAALSSLSPQLKGVLDTLESISRFVNKANVNSCEAAQELIMGATGVITQSDTQKCIMGELMKGVDYNKAQGNCKSNAASLNVANAANPTTAPVAARDSNLMWDALAKTSLTLAEKELLINLVGTVVRRAAKSDTEGSGVPQVIDPSITSLKLLLEGNQDAPGGKVTIKNWWRCAGDTATPPPDKACVKMVMDPAGETIESFPAKVDKLLSQWRDNLNNNMNPGLSGSDTLKLVNNTRIPVYRIMALGYWSPDASFTDQMIARYKTAIGYDFAYVFLTAQLRDAKGYMNNVRAQDSVEEKNLHDLRNSIDKQLAALEAEKMTYLAQEPALNAMVDNIERMDRQFRTTGSPRVREFIGNALAMAKTSPR